MTETYPQKWNLIGKMLRSTACIASAGNGDDSLVAEQRPLDGKNAGSSPGRSGGRRINCLQRQFFVLTLISYTLHPVSPH